MVAPAASVGGASASHCPERASSSWRVRSGMPASTATVMSAGLWLSSRAMPPVSTTTSGSPAARPPQPILVPAPRNTTLPRVAPRTLAASAALPGRSTVVITSAHLLEPLDLEPLDHSGLLQRMWPPRPGPLPAQPGSGQDLAGVADAAGIERGPDQGHDREVGLAEHLQHRAGLVAAHAVLAGDGTALLHAQLHDRGGQVLRLGGLPGHRAVVEHQRVQVAVTGVEHVGHPQPRRARHLADAGQGGAQLGTRDDAVLHEVVRADATHRGERRLAALPDQRPFHRILRDPDARGLVVPADLLYPGELRVDLGR